MQRKISISLVLALLTALLLSACTPVVDTSKTTVTLDNGVVGTLNRPAGATKAPVVLMLHGFGSQKDEVGNMYARLADALLERGVGSLRIDFRGFGKSDGDTGATTVGGQVEDAEAAYQYLAGLDSGRSGAHRRDRLQPRRRRFDHRRGNPPGLVQVDGHLVVGRRYRARLHRGAGAGGLRHGGQKAWSASTWAGAPSC